MPCTRHQWRNSPRANAAGYTPCSAGSDLTNAGTPHGRCPRAGVAALGSWYHAAKIAVEALSDSLRAEVSYFGINVVIIEPGTRAPAWQDRNDPCVTLACIIAR
jgi:NAD(P)-dependent dehydrogenase (short-subunit alcohol dehydrogenase family)